MNDLSVLSRPSSAAHFTDQVRDACQRYVVLPSYRYFGLGPLRLRLAQVGPDAGDTRFTDAIAQHETSPSATDLTVWIVDRHLSGVALPKPVWDWALVGLQGVVQGLERGYFAQFHQDSLLLTWLDVTQKTAFIWADDLQNLPEWERSFPFRTLLHAWLQQQPDPAIAERFVLAHAGAVGTPTGGVLLTGAGGSGKSTATLACLGSGLQYAGDDFVLLDTEQHTVFGLYNVAKLELPNLTRFSHLAGWVANPNPAPGQKYQIFLHQHAPAQVSAGFPVRAVLLPTFSGERNTRISPATPADALRAVAPSTMALLGGDVRALGRLGRLVRQLPAFWLHTGTDLAQIPAIIQTLLSTLPAVADEPVD